MLRPSRRRCSGCPWPEPSCSEGKPLGEQAPGARAAGAATAVDGRRAAQARDTGRWHRRRTRCTAGHPWAACRIDRREPLRRTASYRRTRVSAGSSEPGSPATLIVAGDDEGRGLQQLKPTGEPPHTEARSRSRTWRAAPLAASPQPALSSSRGVAHARSSVLARPVCMARCGAEWGQCRRTKGERAREATPRVENVSVRRGLPSATRPPPAGREGQGQAPSQARPDRARHGPVRTRTRVRPRRM